MNVSIRGKSDKDLARVRRCLNDYAGDHHAAEIVLYRRNSASIRVRIVDPEFTPLSRADRHDLVWNYLEKLPDDVQSQISLLLLLAPRERAKSFADVEFDHPAQSAH